MKIDFFVHTKRETVSGTCVVCQCDDEHECFEGCYWIDRAHTLCSACLTRAMDGNAVLVRTQSSRR